MAKICPDSKEADGRSEQPVAHSPTLEHTHAGRLGHRPTSQLKRLCFLHVLTHNSARGALMTSKCCSTATIKSEGSQRRR